MIEMINITCPVYNSSCKWTGCISDAEQHYFECNFVSLPCICGEKILRKYLTDHLDKHCPNRIVFCRYCESEIIYEQMDYHLLQCGKYELICPNNCSANLFKREVFDDHLRNCPKLSSLVLLMGVLLK